LLAYLSLATAAAGDMVTAEKIAEQITWDDAPNDEGYSDTWERPIVVVDAWTENHMKENLN